MAEKKKWKTIKIEDLNKVATEIAQTSLEDLNIPSNLKYDRTIVNHLAQIQGGYGGVAGQVARDIKEPRKRPAKKKTKGTILERITQPQDGGYSYVPAGKNRGIGKPSRPRRSALPPEEVISEPAYRSVLKYKTWEEQIFTRGYSGTRDFSINPRIGPPLPNTVEFASEELAFSRGSVGYIKGAKKTYQSLVARQISDLQQELSFIESLWNKEAYDEKGLIMDARGKRILEIEEQIKYLKAQGSSRITMREINPIYDKHLKLIQQASGLGVDVSDVGIKSRKRKC